MPNLPLKPEVTFCVQGVITPPCGVTALRSRPGLRARHANPFQPFFCDSVRICSCVDISQFEQPIGHRYGAHRRPGESRHHCCEIVSPIEPILEFSEVARHVLLIDRAVGLSFLGRLGTVRQWAGQRRKGEPPRRERGGPCHHGRIRICPPDCTPVDDRRIPCRRLSRTLSPAFAAGAWPCRVRQSSEAAQRGPTPEK
jgi:hypothetical protein